MTENVNTICLPAAGHRFQEMATIAGWGRLKEGQLLQELMGSSEATKLQTASVNILPSAYCHSNSNTVDERLIICVAVPSARRATCYGDSGGPLMAKIGERVYMIGVLSGGDCGLNHRIHSYYVHVPEKRQWIEQMLTANEDLLQQNDVID